MDASVALYTRVRSVFSCGTTAYSPSPTYTGENIMDASDSTGTKVIDTLLTALDADGSGEVWTCVDTYVEIDEHIHMYVCG